MFHRVAKLFKSHSFFLFGARGTGKTTLIENQFGSQAQVYNLLENELVRRYQKKPDRLRSDILALRKRAEQPMPEWIVIDEIQKVPPLLDVIHDLIQKEKLKFILTGSSARKLKRVSANLLAGRAFVSHLFPLTTLELGTSFDLNFVLHWGSLPHIFELDENDRLEYLRAYARTYLREEILQEQIVRNGIAFQDFLEIAAQENGKTLNFSKIARDVGVDIKTIQSFFSILEDTLVGIRLPAFHRSMRKSQLKHPKFFLFDLGVKRAMERTIDQHLIPRTSAYGSTFEHFIICEAVRLNEYFRMDFRFSHYQTTQGAEVDLILSKSKTLLAIEIKSSDRLDEVDVRRFSRAADALHPTAKFFVSQDPIESKIGDVHCMPWDVFFKRVFE